MKTQDSDSAIAYGRTAGLNAVLTYGVLNEEFALELRDPVTSNIVMHIERHPTYSFTNISTSVFNSKNIGVCTLDGVNVNVAKDSHGVYRPVSIVQPGASAVTVAVSGTGANNPNNLDVLGATQVGVDNLTLKLSALSFNVNQGNLFMGDPQTVLITCGPPSHFGPSVGGWSETREVSQNHSATTYVEINCTNVTQARLPTIVQHEILHALGFSHDTGTDMMNGATEFTSGANLVPINANSYLADLTNSNTNVIIDASKSCQSEKDYLANQCKINPNYDPGCNVAPTPTPPQKITCTNICPSNTTMDPKTCACVFAKCTANCVGGVVVDTPAGCSPYSGATCSGTGTYVPTSPCSCSCGASGVWTCDNFSCFANGTNCTTQVSTCLCYCNSSGTYDCTLGLGNTTGTCSNQGLACAPNFTCDPNTDPGGCGNNGCDPTIDSSCSGDGGGPSGGNGTVDGGGIGGDPDAPGYDEQDE
jgi:hypothetical protein